MKNLIKNTILGLGLIITGVAIGMTNNAQPMPQAQVSTKVQVDEIITEPTDNFYVGEGEIGVTFTDGSWIGANPENNQYTFQPVDLGDWSLEFDNLSDLENCVNTYLSMKNNGWY